MTAIAYRSNPLTRWIVLLLVLWAAGVSWAALAGVLAPLPPLALAGLVVAGIAMPAAAYFSSARLRDWVEAVGLRALTAFHVWRIAAAAMFFAYGAQGLLPDRFVLHAAWGDLIAGALALLVVLRPMRRWRYWGVHLFGMADFVLAVGTGLYFTLTDPEAIAAIREFPLVLIPLFGVGLSGASHLMAFDLLHRGRGFS